MRKDHRRELYSPASTDARDLPDAIGPDGVRVTLRVEPAVDRLLRWRFGLSTPSVLTDPIETYAAYRVAPDWVQRHILRDRWCVNVEADSGVRCLIKATNREDAIGYAEQVRAGVQESGVAFLRTFAK
jgi:hypothetical protein